MHTFFLLSALLLAALVSLLGALLLRLLPVGNRRPAALTVLVLPAAVLGLATTRLVPFFWAECAPLVGWDRVASFSLLGVLAAIGLGAMTLSIGRLLLVDRLLPACAHIGDSLVTAHARVFAERVGLPPPVFRVLPSDSPVAVAGGLRQSSVVLSTWLFDHLARTSSSRWSSTNSRISRAATTSRAGLAASSATRRFTYRAPGTRCACSRPTRSCRQMRWRSPRLAALCQWRARSGKCGRLSARWIRARSRAFLRMPVVPRI